MAVRVGDRSRLSVIDGKIWLLVRSVLHQKFYVTYCDLDRAALRRLGRPVRPWLVRLLMQEIDRMVVIQDDLIHQLVDAQVELGRLRRAE